MKKFKSLIPIQLLFLLLVSTCSKEKESSNDVLFLEKIENIVWTRGTNFKIFKSNPFKLFLVEEGICIEFSEGETLVRENRFSYFVETNTADTLQLNYKVVGDKINHCGTFTYYLDSDENLIRTNKECQSIFNTPQILDFYKSELSFEEVCSN